jgi:hypothetical protein
MWRTSRMSIGIGLGITALLGLCAPLPASPGQADDQKTLQELSARIDAYLTQRNAAAPPAAAAAPSAADARLKDWGARTTARRAQAARPGAVFSPQAADLVRRRLREVLDGSQGATMRAELDESADEHLTARGYERIDVGRAVSAPELPFALAEALPRLPRGLEYRFYGDRLLLRDESTSVLVDVVPDALPRTTKRPSPPSSQAAPPSQAPPLPGAAPPPIAAAAAAAPPLPNLASSVRFAVLGDTGAGRDRDTVFDGKYRAHAVAKLLEVRHATFPFPLVLMTGDNMYTDPDTPAKFAEEVVEPYKALRAKGIVFRAVLGNHDTVDFQLPLAELNLNNRRFYAFQSGNVRFLILHSDEYMRHDADPEQDAFLKTTLATPFAGWTMAAFHHPLFSSGTHSDQNEKARRAYKVLLDGGARVIFTGHEHFYERTKPRPGFAHFVAGSSAKLRKGDLEPSADTERGFDDDHGFMLVEVDGDEMYFQAVALSGRVRDCGVVSRTNAALSTSAAAWAKQCASALGS